MKLEEMRWPQVEEYFKNNDTVVISVGSIENHGTHLCLGTDYLVPGRIIDMIEKKVDVIFTPVMPYGNADHHMAFSGTITLGDDGLYVVMKAVAESLYKHGARKFVFLNGHGGNSNAISKVGMEFNRRGAVCALLNWWQIAPAINKDWLGGHGGAQETSAVLAINEDYVDMSAIKDVTLEGLSQNLPADALGTVLYKGVSIPVQRTMDKVSKAGWSGPDHPKLATKEWGVEMLDTVAEFVAGFIGEFSKIEVMD